jgi:C-terminal processing protease CtpA/Prc
MEYVYNTLRPQAGLRLVLKDPAGKERQLDVAAKMIETKRVADLTGNNDAGDIWDLIRESENEERLMQGRYTEVGDAVMVLKIPEFFFTDSEISDMMANARKHKALILDLRGNPGGSVETLKYMVGCLFDKEIKIADRIERDKSKPMLAKASHHDLYSGKLVVLVDSRSASASELLARVVQIEKRGVVIGDHSSGSVMESRHFSYSIGTDRITPFGASITEADLIMTDGKSLEHSGVTPDEIVIPTGSDLAEGRDPVLAHAVEILGSKLSPEAAGKMFPFEWPRN